MANKETRQQELRRIYDRDGYVRASTLVKESRPKKAPLHDEFEWDDAVAAHEYRLDQGRYIIRHTVYVTEEGARTSYVNSPVEVIDGPTAVVREKEGVYKPVTVIVKEPKEFERALRQLLTQRDAMERTIKEMERAARAKGLKSDLLPQLKDAMRVVKSTLRLMLQESQTSA